MTEAEEAMQFAHEAKQADALVKVIKLRARLHRLLLERVVVIASVSIQAACKDNGAGVSLIWS
jgi:hypothetical protein